MAKFNLPAPWDQVAVAHGLNASDTKYELEFIFEAGTHCQSAHHQSVATITDQSPLEGLKRRLYILYNYRESTGSRNWGRIDPSVIKEFLKEQIAKTETAVKKEMLAEK